MSLLDQPRRAVLGTGHLPDDVVDQRVEWTVVMTVEGPRVGTASAHVLIDGRVVASVDEAEYAASVLRHAAAMAERWVDEVRARLDDG